MQNKKIINKNTSHFKQIKPQLERNEQEILNDKKVWKVLKRSFVCSKRDVIFF